VLCTSFDDFQTKFGGFTPDSDLALAAMGFFENGGAQLWVVRTAHYSNVATPRLATAVRAAGFLVAGGGPTPGILLGAAPGPFVLARRRPRFVSPWTAAPDADAVFNGSAAAMAAGGAGPYALADGMTLLLRVDNGLEQTVLFSSADFADIANATATEVAAAINAVIVGGRATTPGGIVRLASDTEGTSSRVQVTGGTANAVLAFPGAASVGGGNVANLRAVEVAEVKAVVEAAIPTVTVDAGVGGVLDIRTVATGPGASVQAAAATAAAFGLDTTLHTGAASGTANSVRVEGKDPGAYANRDRGRGPRRDQRLAQRVRPPRRRGRRLPRGLPEPLDEPQRRALRREHRQRRAQRLASTCASSTNSSWARPSRRPKPWRSRAGATASSGSTTTTSSAASPARPAFTRSTRCRSCRCSSCRGAPRRPSTTRWCATRGRPRRRRLRRARPAREPERDGHRHLRRDDRRAREALRVRAPSTGPA
jgi:hypothetical protein